MDDFSVIESLEDYQSCGCVGVEASADATTCDGQGDCRHVKGVGSRVRAAS